MKHDELVKSLAGRMLYFEADDGRICLVYDYLGLALVGSTDIQADNPDDGPLRRPEEVDYLLDSVRTLLPGMAFERDQIVYAYSGIRPLPASDASTPGLISRDHSAPVAEPDGDRPFPDHLAGRRQMDDVPRLCRGSRRHRARAPAAQPQGDDASHADRRRQGFPSHCRGARRLAG